MQACGAFRHVGGPAGRRQRPGRPSGRPERADDMDSHVETQQSIEEETHEYERQAFGDVSHHVNE